MPNTYETKLWGGRFRGDEDALMQHFNSECWRTSWLVEPDIQGSLAHVAMQVKCGLLTSAEGEALTRGLETILADFKAGQLVYTEEYEDVHTFVELHLIRRVGDVGKKLHTARSRNDQVALDFRLFVKEEIPVIVGMLLDLEKALLRQAESNLDAIMPGYTHLQRAQPITFAHAMMAYANMFRRDITRLEDCRARLDESPLGSGALATSTHPVDRFRTAELLGFSKPMDNSLDGVSDRDFAIEFLSACSILMMHLSRFSEELILWCSWEFQFITLDDAYATGSSIMPQKKNPDVAELVRGKTGRVYGALITLLTVMKGIPLAYNKDMQEDKEPVFDTIDTVELCLPVFTAMIDTLTVNRANMRRAANGGFISATDCADYLAKKGMPFREAYGIVGKLVGHCMDTGHSLETLPLEEYQKVSPYFQADVYDALSLETCVEGRKVYGGPAPEAVKVQMEHLKQFIQEREA